MQYLKKYPFKDDPYSELIEECLVINDEKINEGKIGDWIFIVPQIKKLQEKANRLRLKSARAEAVQRKEIDRAVDLGKDINTSRMWNLLQKKLDSWEDSAREYELEAIEIAQKNDYLRRVQRAERLKGKIKINKEKISVAESEERRELIKDNKKMLSVIKDEEHIVINKIKDEKERQRDVRTPNQIKITNTRKEKLDSTNMYFRNKKAERERK
jgi:hypothetical protein